ncbi:MAG: PAS domain S-box protein, partial [Cytophagaceae bacterium]
WLEDRLKNTRHVIANVLSGEIQNARITLRNNQDDPEHTMLMSLVEKSVAIDSHISNINEDKTYAFLKIIMECMPFPFFIKDETGKYILINSLEADLFGLDEKSIIGKHDSDFVRDEEELEVIIKSDHEVLFGYKSVELPEQKFSLKNGKSFVFKTHKVPFVNPMTGKHNILGFSVDVSDSVNLNKLQSILMICNNPYL